MLTFSLFGKDSLISKLERLPQEINKSVKRAVIESALLVETEAKRSIQRGPKSGKIYKRGGVTHQASAPGEAPATDTGVLVGSVSHRVKRDGFEAEVGTNVKYGAHLEFGTSKMAARPWLQPALEANRDKITKRIITEVNKALNDTAKR